MLTFIHDFQKLKFSLIIHIYIYIVDTMSNIQKSNFSKKYYLYILRFSTYYDHIPLYLEVVSAISVLFRTKLDPSVGCLLVKTFTCLCEHINIYCMQMKCERTFNNHDKIKYLTIQKEIFTKI